MSGQTCRVFFRFLLRHDPFLAGQVYCHKQTLVIVNAFGSHHDRIQNLQLNYNSHSSRIVKFLLSTTFDESLSVEALSFVLFLMALMKNNWQTCHLNNGSGRQVLICSRKFMTLWKIATQTVKLLNNGLQRTTRLLLKSLVLYSSFFFHCVLL